MDMLKLAEEIIAGRRLTRQDDLQAFLTCDLNELCQGADKIRAACVGDHVDLCSIIIETALITQAYEKLMQHDRENVTDDAMVVEQEMQIPVKLFEGSYCNIKITTPEDLETAKGFIEHQ